MPVPSQTSSHTPTTTRQAVIAVRSLRKVYDEDGVPVEAVRGIDMEIASGEFTAIVGPSGSGKTTLLNLIAGLDTPTEGSVTLAGKPISEMSGGELSDFRRDHIGFIFQAYNLIPVLTVEENIEYIMLLQGVDKAKRHARVKEILGRMDLDGYQDRLPTKLSGGQQQRVAVARAMAAEPDLILADEPTANLDTETGGALLDMMRELNETTGMTFVFSTHDELVMERARRLIVLRDGDIHKDERQDG
ncbi:MAG: ATP-binding cassette domain-containing protein [Candidatus Eisenbacteria bacterium]|nr:ATP-binding cassette domain-containing protein [Candidatus Eisenbacteria bacterium]